eukprot:m.970562 g.970562  ORF g.970562 m.970562 type:complete len:184 (+) comp23924_c0_seq15:418-969(+)
MACIAPMELPTACPKECTVPGPKNTTICEKAWLQAGCKSMIPPKPPPPPSPPKPYKPTIVGPAHCTITVGVKAKPFDQEDTEILPVHAPVFDSISTGLNPLFDASTRASRRMRQNQADFNEVWAQLTAQGKVPGSPPKLIPIYGGSALLFLCVLCWIDLLVVQIWRTAAEHRQHTTVMPNVFG